MTPHTDPCLPPTLEELESLTPEQQTAEYGKAETLLHHAGAAVARAYSLVSWIQLRARQESEEAALRMVGQFLVEQRQFDLLKLMYVVLRERDATSDAIRSCVPHDEYRPDDELRFALGKGWRTYMASVRAADTAPAEEDDG